MVSRHLIVAAIFTLCLNSTAGAQTLSGTFTGTTYNTQLNIPGEGIVTDPLPVTGDFGISLLTLQCDSNGNCTAPSGGLDFTVAGQQFAAFPGNSGADQPLFNVNLSTGSLSISYISQSGHNSDGSLQFAVPSGTFDQYGNLKPGVYSNSATGSGEFDMWMAGGADFTVSSVTMTQTGGTVPPTPLPASAWLFLFGLAALVAFVKPEKV